MDDGKSFGRRVREERVNRKWSRALLARLVESRGVRMFPTTLKRIEDGDQVAKVHEAAAICDVFGVSLSRWTDSDQWALSRYVEELINVVDEISELRERWTAARNKVRITWDALTEEERAAYSENVPVDSYLRMEFKDIAWNPGNPDDPA